MRTGILLAGLLAAAPALAQTDPVGQARQAAANQLGTLEYCKAQGFVGDDAVEAQRGVIARLPASSVSTDAAEAAGKDGAILSPDGKRMTLASMASGQGGSVSDLCKHMGAAVIQASSMMRNAPGGMPQMPAGMPAMPSLSGGMPTMPTMPGMPGAAPSR